jgi:hypothetical protein
MFLIHSSKKLIKSSIAFGAARSAIALSFLAAIVAQAQSSYAINFTFDYSYDDNSFFSDSTPLGNTTVGQARKNTLEAAADYFEPFTDNLSAINPGGSNTWTATFLDPSGAVDGNGNFLTKSVSNLQVNPNELIVYVGGGDIGSLGLGGYGGASSITGDSNFVTAALNRGQTGASNSPATDFARWGGSLSFNDTVTWNSDLDSPTSGENDFLSVAIHELGHLLGFGIAPSWDNQISGSDFTGTNSVTAYGGNVPLSDPGHWAENTMSTVNGISQETAMAPYLYEGTRKLFTTLDYAGLKDVGWETQSVPFEFSPGLGLVLVGGLYGLNKAKKTVFKK